MGLFNRSDVADDWKDESRIVRGLRKLADMCCAKNIKRKIKGY